MIVDKSTLTPGTASSPEPMVSELTPIQEAVQTNPMVEAYKAVKEILLSIKEDSDDPNSLPFFNKNVNTLFLIISNFFPMPL